MMRQPAASLDESRSVLTAIVTHDVVVGVLRAIIASAGPAAAEFGAPLEPR